MAERQQNERKTRQESGRDAGFTLMEVVLGSCLIVGLLVALVMSVGLGSSMNNLAAQNTMAFSKCRSRLEAMRSTNYVDISTNNFPEATVDLGITGRKRLALSGTVTNWITVRTNPARKEIEIGVRWEYRGKMRTQKLYGVVYDKR
jgi:type II secretory pathway pseudopilin PulG